MWLCWPMREQQALWKVWRSPNMIRPATRAHCRVDFQQLLQFANRIERSQANNTSTASSPHRHSRAFKMSSGQRQDYLARIRYSNTLPPPPNPPKLLDIPGTGLAGGTYTSAGYATRLVREQPLNIEADGELGMPIDLIGIPGIFDGDERGMLRRMN